MSSALVHDPALEDSESLDNLLARKAWREAEELLYLNIREDPRDPTNYVVLSHVLLRQGNAEAAAQQLSNAEILLNDEVADPHLKEELIQGIEAQRAIILVEQTARSRAQESSDPNPYKSIPDYAHWHRSVVDRPSADIPIQHEPRFKITTSTSIASAGSCFAQNIARWLDNHGYTYLVTEPGPSDMPSDERDNHGYGLYTARYGNIYTALQLVQLFDRAYGEFCPAEFPWPHEEGFVDPFRPRVQEPPFRSILDLFEDRENHFASVRRMFEDNEVFIFTLGLTEAWRSKEDGAIFPICPGTAAGTFSRDKYEYVNFVVDEVADHLNGFVERLADVNPQARIILTVSPVPLVATQEDRPVLQSTVYSKSVLRVAAALVRERHANVEYFASYEMITHPYQWRANATYGVDRRTVTDRAIDQVMGVFQATFCEGNIESNGPSNQSTQANPSAKTSPRSKVFFRGESERHGLQAPAIVCDELDAYGEQQEADPNELTSRVWEFYDEQTIYVFCPEDVLLENDGNPPRTLFTPEGYDQKLFNTLHDWLTVILNSSDSDGAYLCLGSSHTARATNWPFYLHRHMIDSEEGSGKVINMGAMGQATKFQPGLLQEAVRAFTNHGTPIRHAMALVGANDIFNWYVALLQFAQGKIDTLPWTSPRDETECQPSLPARPNLDLATRWPEGERNEHCFPVFRPSPIWDSIVAKQILGDAQKLHEEAQSLGIPFTIALQPIASEMLYGRHAQMVRSAFENSGEESYFYWRMRNQIKEHVGEFAAFQVDGASTQRIFDYDGLYTSLIEYFQSLNESSGNQYVDMSRCFSHIDHDHWDSAFSTDAFHYATIGSEAIADCFLNLITD